MTQNQTQREREEQARQERTQRDDERMKLQRGRNAEMQNAPQGQRDIEEIDGLIKQEYEGVDQPGLHPANQPARDTVDFKTTRDLEDITGNPGHRGLNPNAPGFSMNRNMPDERDNPPSINEPPDVRQAPRHEVRNQTTAGDTSTPVSINEPPGSEVIPPGIQDGGNEQQGEAPVLESLDPDEVEAGSPDDITMHVHGTGFTENSVIYFNGLVEPTTFVSETEVTTGVKPSLFTVPAVCPVTVRNGSKESEALEFEFTDAVEDPASRKSKRTKPKPQKKHHRR